MPTKAMQTPGELDKWNSADSDSTSSTGSFLSKDLGFTSSTASSSVNPTRTSLEKVQVDSTPFTLREAPPILESLPVEIFILIFKEISDSESLRFFLLSSPLLLPIYRLAKQEILPCILRNQYGPLLGEAVAAVRSRGLYLETHKDEAINLLDTWRRSDEVRKLAPESFSRIDVPRNVKEMRDLFRLYEVLRFFLKGFEKSAMWPLWVDSKTWRDSVLPLKLSKTEQYRFLRALCRLHTHANIFGRAEYPLDDPVPGYPFRNDWREDEIIEPFSLDEEAYRLFFSTMPPWECDEMGCVWRHLSDKVDCLYPGVCDSLTNLMGEHGLRDHIWFEELPQSARPVYCAVFNSLPSLRNLSWSTSSLVAVGPDFVYRLLHATPLLRHEMVLSNADYTQDTFIGGSSRVWVDDLDNMPLIYPADQHAVPGFDQLWSDLLHTQKPNLAWRLFRLMPHTPEDNLESVIYEDEELGWDWGHALWDDERLNEWTSNFLPEGEILQF